MEDEIYSIHSKTSLHDSQRSAGQAFQPLTIKLVASVSLPGYRYTVALGKVLETLCGTHHIHQSAED